MRKYNHTTEQQQHLLETIRDLSLEILGADFDDPKADEQMIRFVIYRKGMLAAYKEMYEDNFTPPALPTAFDQPEG